MEKTTKEKAEKIKKIIVGAAEQSKETIREIIVSNNKIMDSALDSNSKVFKSIKEKLSQQEIPDHVSDSIKKTFGQSVELAEETLDGIIRHYMRQLEAAIDFHVQLIDAILESNSTNAGELVELIRKNFEASQSSILENANEMIAFYNRHTNLALNFGKKFEENIHSQIESFFAIQNKGLSSFSSLVTDWWRQDEKEQASA